jgi:pantetheine-phosphate adenylyltransferase
MQVALYPGSFDPVTNGHVDVVRNAARLAGRLVIAIGVHPGKTPLFTVDDRIAMLQGTCGVMVREAGCGFTCITFDDLAVSVARRVGRRRSKDGRDGRNEEAATLDGGGPGLVLARAS